MTICDPNLNPVSIPSLSTERLVLRGHRVEDFAACAALWGDPDVTRYIGGAPSPPSRAWGRILKYVGHWALLGYGYWAIEEKATGRLIGEAGLADFRREITPAITVPEIGWVLAPSAWGRGFASEAVAAITAWADKTFPDGRTMCLIDPQNAASIRVARKAGYHPIRTVTFSGDAVLWFERG